MNISLGPNFLLCGKEINNTNTLSLHHSPISCSLLTAHLMYFAAIFPWLDPIASCSKSCLGPAMPPQALLSGTYISLEVEPTLPKVPGNSGPLGGSPQQGTNGGKCKINIPAPLPFRGDSEACVLHNPQVFPSGTEP